MLARPTGRSLPRSASSISIAESAQVWESSSSITAWRAWPVWWLAWARTRLACSAQGSGEVVVRFIGAFSLGLIPADQGRDESPQIGGREKGQQVDAGGDGDDRGARRELRDLVADDQAGPGGEDRDRG